MKFKISAMGSKDALKADYILVIEKASTAVPRTAFGPYGFNELKEELSIIADIPPVTARNLILDAFTQGEITHDTEDY